MTSSIRKEGDEAAAEDIHQRLTATWYDDIHSNCDVAGRDVRSRQSVSDSDMSVCDKCIRYILLCDVVQCCNDICFGATHTFPSKRHLDRQESGKASFTSRTFMSETHPKLSPAFSFDHWSHVVVPHCWCRSGEAPIWPPASLSHASSRQYAI